MEIKTLIVTIRQREKLAVKFYFEISMTKIITWKWTKHGHTMGTDATTDTYTDMDMDIVCVIVHIRVRIGVHVNVPVHVHVHDFVCAIIRLPN